MIEQVMQFSHKFEIFQMQFVTEQVMYSHLVWFSSMAFKWAVMVL